MHGTVQDENRLASMWLVQGKEGGNGTFVNGKRICGRQQLKEGDIVGFGHGHDIQVGCSVDPVALVYEFEFQYRTEIT
jgi:pSer/pThr/pTyr-binding forkhead associated (FHA) protein